MNYNNPNVIFVTEEELKSLEQDLSRKEKRLSELLTERMHCGTNRIGPDGDYQTAGVDSEIYILNAEINELKYQLRNAQVISKNNTSDESEIDIGDTVTLLDVNKGEIRLVKLAGGIARLGDEIPSISLKSPMGRSIIGKNVGDVVSYDVKDKNGKVINHVTVQILEVKKEKVESKEKS